MKNNSILTTLVFVLAFVVATVYSVLYYTGTIPAVSPAVTNGTTLSLVVIASLAAMPLLCLCKNDRLCKVVKNYLTWVIMGFIGSWVSSGLLPLITVSTRLSYVLSQFVTVFFGTFLPVIWGLFLYEIITAAVCGCGKQPKECNIPTPDDDCFDPGYNKYKY